jgi:hypothetical protein
VAINGATAAKYMPTQTGSYTVTASAAGFVSKTGAAVEVSAIANLSGNVTITPNSNVFTGTELTAAYSGSDASITGWQWSRNGTAISGATVNRFTPTEAGSYTVTASAVGFNSKNSTAVTVTVRVFTVSFDPDSDSPTPQTQNIEDGKKVNKPQDPTKAFATAALYLGAATGNYNHTFDGWYNGATKWNFDTDVATQNITLKARWIAGDVFNLTRIETVPAYNLGVAVT